MKDILSDKNKVKEIIEMFKSQIATLEQEKSTQQQYINAIQEKLNDYKNKLPILENYYEFLDLVGFSKIKQEVESHAEEIRHAREERLRENEG